MVLRAAEGEHWVKNKRQQKQPDSVSGAFPKRFGHVDGKNDKDNQVHERDEQQDHPPAGATGDFAKKVQIDDWNDRGPTGLAGFGKDFPERSDHQDDEDQFANPEDWAGSVLRCVIGRFLSEEWD